MRNKLYKSLIYIVPLFVIMILVLWYKDLNYYPKIFGDEYGYWAAGAFFAGIDWDDITVLNDYYGWGYGIILGVLLRLPVSIRISYMIAIALNGIFLWLIYCIYYKLISELFSQKSTFFACILAFASAVLPTSLYYTQFTMSEVALELIYSLLLYTYWSMLQQNSVAKMLVLVFLDSLMMSIHLRTIGIVAVSVVIVLAICIKERKKAIQHFLFFFVLLVIMTVSFIGIKKYYLNGISLGFIQMSDHNTASGQVGKLSFLLTHEGIKSFVANMIGRFFSLFVNSYMLAFPAMTIGIVEFVKGIKNRCLSRTTSISIICILNTLSLITISALFMIGGTTSRFDILTYTRYHEFATGALIFLGIYWIGDYSRRYNLNLLFLLSGTLLLCLTRVVGSIMDYSTSTASLFQQNPVLYFSYMRSSSTKDIFITLSIVALIVYLLLYVFLKLNKTKLVAITLSGVIVWGIYVSDYVFRTGCLSWSEIYFAGNDSMASFIETNNYQQSLCFLADDDVLRVELLQFTLKEDSIMVVNEDQLYDKMGEGYILIATSDYNGDADLVGCEVIYEANDLYLWRAINE